MFIDISGDKPVSQRPQMVTVGQLQLRVGLAGLPRPRLAWFRTSKAIGEGAYARVVGALDDNGLEVLVSPKTRSSTGFQAPFGAPKKGFLSDLSLVFYVSNGHIALFVWYIAGGDQRDALWAWRWHLTRRQPAASGL